MHRILALVLMLLSFHGINAQSRFGGASIDISPAHPVRLSGYAARKTESSEVALPLFAKALAIEQQPGVAALIIAIDNCGISRAIWEELAASIEKKHGIPSERVVIFSTHTHAAPALTGAIANLFVAPLPENEQAAVDRYTRELVGRIQEVAAKALGSLAPGRLYLARGTVGFAKNRRTEGGPVDHDLPILVAKNAKGEIKAVLANYACHCTTLGGDFNRAHPDWAGVAQAVIQEKNPGALALVSIGCGADANPHPRGTLDHVQAHGEALAAEVQRLLGGDLKELGGGLAFSARSFELPFDSLPSREEWTKRAAQDGIVGYHAKRNLERLDRGEKLSTSLPYRVQTWTFGNELAMVFLPGEVVVDYSLRLKSTHDPERLWISAYANWVPCYIPSERILKEGGYEAESSLWYYDRPARLSSRTEGLVIEAVEGQLPKEFRR